MAIRFQILSFFSVIFFSIPSLAATYEIVVRNKTPQTLTQSVCAVHSKKVQLFEVGETASDGLATLAEDGSASAFASEMRSTKGVRSVTTGKFVSPNKKSKFQIESNRGRRASCVLGMLIATNDGFPGFRSVRLPRNVGDRKRFRAFAYDAGSEVNTESCEHVPGGPCNAHFIGEKENGTVQRHPGIQGISDLSVESHGWSEPSVAGRIKRID